MRFREAQRAFGERYYRWALADARREVAEGFRFVRSVKGVIAQRFLAYVELLSPIERVELMSAMVRRFHRQAGHAADEPLTDREHAMLDRKDGEMLRPRSPGHEPAMRASRGSNKRRLASGVHERLVQIPRLVNTGAVGERYEIRIGSWSVFTSLSYGRPPYYCHYIRDDSSRSLLEWGSLFSWLGIAGQTTWDLAQAGDAKETAEAMASVCNHFLGSVSELLTDLSIDSSP
jgi:hypothetical protein